MLGLDASIMRAHDALKRQKMVGQVRDVLKMVRSCKDTLNAVLKCVFGCASGWKLINSWSYYETGVFVNNAFALLLDAKQEIDDGTAVRAIETGFLGAVRWLTDVLDKYECGDTMVLF